MLPLRHWSVSLMLVGVIILFGAEVGAADPGIEAITNPSADVTLSFVQPGRIATVYLQEGDTVKAGQVLVKQDDAVEQAQLAQTEALSKNTTQIEAAKASLEQKRVDLERIEWAAERGAATKLEVAHTQLEVTIAKLSLDVAQFEHDQAKRKYEEGKIRVENMRLKSPVSGTVEKVEVEVGESVNGLEGVIRVVRIDPLWIDLHVPLDKSGAIKSEQFVEVRFNDTLRQVIKGKIIFVAAVADAASSTLRTRIEVANKSMRPAGEHVKVILRPRRNNRKNSKDSKMAIAEDPR